MVKIGTKIIAKTLSEPVDTNILMKLTAKVSYAFIFESNKKNKTVFLTFRNIEIQGGGPRAIASQ